MSRLQKYRVSQLKKCLDGGLRQGILKFRNVSGIPMVGYPDQRSADAWKDNLALPLPTIIKEGGNTATPQEEKEVEVWLEKSLAQQNQLNKTILRLVTQTLCKRYHLGDEWVETIELLLLYPEGSALIKLPGLFSFVKVPSETEGEKINIDLSKDTVASDFESKEFSASLGAARRAVKVAEALAKDNSYQVLLKHTGRKRRRNPTLDLLPIQPMWPWMETLHEVNGLLQLFSDIDSQAYKQIITQLERVFDKLKDSVAERERHLGTIQDSYTKKVDLSELTPERAQSDYETNINAIYQDQWQKEDLQIAGSVLKKAKKITESLEKGWQRKVRKATESVPQRKRLKFA